ncbi:hypothetical protein LPY66_12125 [Dehalobacter sp. DCM]|uniref:hypothetical protein n=1 Tax=Dehalobacter sp. DCM TaxID=2907827 RepID=UPI0030820D10|nr:hypothetical protein LPY66_12125 [Dehalobacter sp. DCM]
MMCTKCNQEIPIGEEMTYWGQILCEDCYVDVVSVPRTCDVAAVHSAKLTRKMTGHEGTDGLTELQKRIYDFVKENQQALPSTLMHEFNLSEDDLLREVSVLRHCELLKGTMINGQKYIVRMDNSPQ